MANRTFQEKKLTLIKRLCEIYCVVDVGAAGAVTLLRRTWAGSVSTLSTAPTTGSGYAVGGDGVHGVTRLGAGQWRVLLSDPYQYPLGVEICRTYNATGVPSVAAVGILSGTTNTGLNTAVGNGGLVDIQLVDFAGAAADPTSGDRVTLRFTLGDATEP